MQFLQSSTTYLQVKGILCFSLIIDNFLKIKIIHFYFITDEDVLIDDMMLNPEQIKYMRVPSGFSNAREGLQFRWDGGEMPYEIDKSILKNLTRVKNIENAVGSFNKRTCGCLYIRYLQKMIRKLSIKFVLN